MVPVRGQLVPKLRLQVRHEPLRHRAVLVWALGGLGPLERHRPSEGFRAQAAVAAGARYRDLRRMGCGRARRRDIRENNK